MKQDLIDAFNRMSEAFQFVGDEADAEPVRVVTPAQLQLLSAMAVLTGRVGVRPWLIVAAFIGLGCVILATIGNNECLASTWAGGISLAVACGLSCQYILGGEAFLEGVRSEGPDVFRSSVVGAVPVASGRGPRGIFVTLILIVFTGGVLRCLLSGAGFSITKPPPLEIQEDDPDPALLNE